MLHPPIKSVIIGDVATGKTTLVHSILGTGDRTTAPTPSMQNKFMHETITLDGLEVPLQIWDTPGQESYRTLVPLAVRDAEIALLVFALDCRDSFVDLSGWRELLQQHTKGLKAVILIGNKRDQREVTETIGFEEARQKCEELNCTEYLETCAIQGDGVDDLKNSIVRNAAGPRIAVPPVRDIDQPEAKDRCCRI
jgi:small GTP-binding protein